MLYHRPLFYVYLLWMTVVWGGAHVWAQESESLGLELEPWGLESPAQLRFGVLSLQRMAPEKDWHLRGLNRLMAAIPQRTPAQASSRKVQGETALLARLDHAGKNILGGGFGAFQRAPARAEVKLLAQLDGRMALTLSSFREALDAGFAGGWIQLCDPEQRIFLDVRGFESLSFWVRGHGRYRVKLADQRWFDKDDALTIGPLESYLSSGSLNGDWQQVVLPLADLPEGLNRSALATLVIETLGPGFGQLALSTVALNKSGQSPLVLPPLPSKEVPQSTLKKSKMNRATWIWHIEDWLQHPEILDLELPFLKAQAVGDLYLQWPDLSTQSKSALVQLVQRLHQEGFRVHALDGDPHFALKAQHDKLYQIVQSILDFNHDAASDARFDGLQLDVEAYLLPEFYGLHAEQIKRDFIHVIAEVYRRVEPEKLDFGVAVPLWLDQADEFTAQLPRLEFEGQEALLSEHLQQHSDYIAVMDYRTQIWGAAGILAGIEQELSYATRHQKRVVIGLETMALPDEQLYLLRGQPQADRPDIGQAALMIWPTAEMSEGWQMRYLPVGQPAPSEKISAQVYFWPLSFYVETPASALSFAGSGAVLPGVIAQIESDLRLQPAFAGLALHHGRSWAELYRQKKSEEPDAGS